MTTEQGGAPSATAGGAPAPTIPPAQVRATAEYLARMVGCYVAEVPPPLPPFKRRPVLGEPKPNMAGNEDGDTWAEGVGWALSWGCQLTFGRDEHTAVPYVQVSLSDEDRRRGITQRSATRAQVAAFARMLTEQFGEPSTVVPDPRDAEIERLRGEVEGLETQRDRRQTLWQTRYGQLIGGALDVQQHLQRALGKPALPSDKFDPDYSRSMVDGLKAERDRLRKELDTRPDETALRDLANTLHAVEDNDPCGLPEVTLAHVRTLINCVGSTSAEYRAECVRLGAENATVKDERDDYAGRLRDTDAAYAKVAAERDLFRDALVAINGAIGQTERLAAAITADKREPRRWVAGDPEPEIGTTVRQSGDWGSGPTWTRRRHGWHPDHDCSDRTGQCGGAGPFWSELPRPLVEVVNSDGD